MRTLPTLVLLLLLPGGTAAQTAPPSDRAPKPRKLAIANKPWTGDFDKLLERRMIRVYAPFSRSLYLSEKGRERGRAGPRLGAVPECQIREAARQPPPDDLYRAGHARQAAAVRERRPRGCRH